MTPRTSSSASLLALAALVGITALTVACSGSTADVTTGAEPELGTGPALASADLPVLEPKLDSADPADMDPDGSCGGEELPKNDTSEYPLKFVEHTSCGAAVFEGTIKWTTDGKVTRKMRLTDYRVGTCATKPARLVAEVTSTYQGETNKIGTFFTVDPR